MVNHGYKEGDSIAITKPDPRRWKRFIHWILRKDPPVIRTVATIGKIYQGTAVEYELPKPKDPPKYEFVESPAYKEWQEVNLRKLQMEAMTTEAFKNLVEAMNASAYGHYFDRENITLDGVFTLDDLKKIIEYIEATGPPPDKF